MTRVLFQIKGGRFLAEDSGFLLISLESLKWS